MYRLRFAPAPSGFLHIGNLKIWIINTVYGECDLRVDNTNHQITKKWLKYTMLVAEIFNIQIKRFYTQNTVYSNIRYINFLNKIEKCIFYDEKCVKLNIPGSGSTTINKNLIQYNLTYKPVLLKSNGKPTYFLASICDDFDWNIDCVVRGSDHIETTHISQFIYKYLRFKTRYIHINMMLSKDNKKVSKSQGSEDIIKFVHRLGIMPYSLNIYLLKPSSNNLDIKNYLNKSLKYDEKYGYIYLDETKILNINRMLLQEIGFDYFFKHLNFYILYKGIDILIDKDFMEVIFRIYRSRYKEYNSFVELYNYLINSKYNIDTSNIKVYNELFLLRSISKRDKRKLQVNMMVACNDSNTPKAQEVIEIYEAKKIYKKKQDNKKF